MKNRGVGRGRLFVGSFLMFAAVIVWAVGLLMDPYGASVGGNAQVRDAVVVYLRNSALATIALAAFAAFLLFPARRPRWPARDRLIAALAALLILTSLYQLFWLFSVVN